MPAVPARSWKAAAAMTLSLHRIITRISVRTRIIVLAAIPVVGFLVNGIAFTAGEREVESAFGTADRASDLAEASREFHGALIQMRVRDARFRRAAEPGADPALRDHPRHRGPHASASSRPRSTQPTRQKLAPLKGQLEEIAAQFDDLARNQKILGFTESEGIRNRMTKAAASRGAHHP